MYCMYVHTDFNVGNIDNRESQKPENFVGSFDIDSQEDGCNNCISVLQSPRVRGVEIDNCMQLAR
jgi:hypothetical protein